MSSRNWAFRELIACCWIWGFHLISYPTHRADSDFRATGRSTYGLIRRPVVPAAELLAQASAGELETILREFGEEPLARPLAEFLVKRRAIQPVRTGAELGRVVSECPAFKRMGASEKHPATRVFQALRIAVNQELEHVERGISQSAYRALKPGGLLGVITFHSLEDRLVKNEFRNDQRWENLTSKPIVATPQEQRFNPRSRSAKLRVAMKKA